MMNLPKLSILFFTIFLFTSCSKRLTPFTDNLVEQFDWSDTDLKRIQFYLSEDIVLKKARGGSRSSIEGGRIEVDGSKEIEQIVFKKGTPGVFVFTPKEDRIAISFESGKDKYLMFGPNDKYSGKYVLLAKEWSRHNGKVTYNGQTYNTTSESAYATLMVDLRKAQKTSLKKKTVKGQRI